MCMYFSHGDDVIALLSSFAYHSSLDCGRYTNICVERLWIPSNDVLSATINYSANFPEFPFNKSRGDVAVTSLATQMVALRDIAATSQCDVASKSPGEVAAM